MSTLHTVHNFAKSIRKDDGTVGQDPPTPCSVAAQQIVMDFFAKLLSKQPVDLSGLADANARRAAFGMFDENELVARALKAGTPSNPLLKVTP